ncbi:MAG: CoA transferase [Alphaproteobacteria bacterium]|nr:CoA transferase [Alphaproteobacteria bacterium]MCB9931247.1 CoA transferase [Alphaproteobacteria bacterium]
MTTEPRAFEGVNVLDFTQGVAGPHSTMLLAQHGANVLKIEPPEGDWGRTLGAMYGDQCAHSIAFNRGKRSLAMDMKQPDAQAVARKIAEKADVIVEAFRPGVMAKFGLSYDQVKAFNPNVIYLSVTGFGQTGPNSKLPVTDAVIQAFSGLMTVNKDKDGLPQRLNMIPVDVTTGLYAFQAISTALMRKFRYGVGCYIDNNLMQSAAAFQAAKIMEFYLEKGESQPLYVPVGTMQTTDGFINITAMREAHYHSLCDVMGKPDWKDDPRFNSREARLANEKVLMPLIREVFSTRSTQDWAESLTAAGVMNAPVQNYGDLMQAEQVKAVDAIAYVDHTETGTIPMPHIPGQPRITGPDALTHAPTIGEHSDEILAEWGYSAADIAGMKANGAVKYPALAAAAE